MSPSVFILRLHSIEVFIRSVYPLFIYSASYFLYFDALTHSFEYLGVKIKLIYTFFKIGSHIDHDLVIKRDTNIYYNLVKL